MTILYNWLILYLLKIKSHNLNSSVPIGDNYGSISTVSNDFSGYDKIMSDPRVIECINTPMPKPILTGDDLIAGGLKPSPLFKKMLRVAYRHQYEDNEIDKERLFNFVKNIKE